MTEDQIKFMVGRFLAWKLPEDFNPDGGITFKRTFNEHTAHPMKHEPSGTNLFGFSQAEAMVRHMVDALPNDDWVTGIVGFFVEHGMLDQRDQYCLDDVMAALRDNYEPTSTVSPDLLCLIYQYRDDLHHPPEHESKTRRLSAINAVLAKVSA